MEKSIRGKLENWRVINDEEKWATGISILFEQN